MNRASRSIPEPVIQLQRQLEQFRNSQPARTKLPESVWQAAVELARQHGVYRVAPSSTAGLYEVKGTPRRPSDST
jgi:hypothetical protein